MSKRSPTWTFFIAADPQAISADAVGEKAQVVGSSANTGTWTVWAPPTDTTAPNGRDLGEERSWCWRVFMRIKVYRTGLWSQRNLGESAKGKKL